MPVNTQNAVAQGIDLGISEAEYRSLSSRERAEIRRRTPGTYAYERAGGAAAETRDITPDVITGGRGTVVEQLGERATYAASRPAGGRGSLYEQPGERAAALTETTSSAADSFTVGYDAGQVDPALARALEEDTTTGTPSPSTIQATNAAPAGTTSPSLASRRSSTFSNISPRPYFRIDPLDNRYDFLTGQKINTTGGQPNINNPVNYTGGNTTGGIAPDGNPGTSDISIGYDEGQVDPALAAAAGLEGNLVDTIQSGDVPIGYNEGQVDPALAVATGAVTSATESVADAVQSGDLATTGTNYVNRSSAEIGARREGWPRSQLRNVVIDNGDGTFSVLAKE